MILMTTSVKIEYTSEKCTSVTNGFYTLKINNLNVLLQNAAIFYCTELQKNVR